MSSQGVDQIESSGTPNGSLSYRSCGPPAGPNSSLLNESEEEEEDEDEEEEEENEELCPTCEPKHVQRRLVVCVDGTWMVPDGAIGSFHGNPSNMARVWSMIKEGRVRDPSGKPWHQSRAFVEGIGAVSEHIERGYAGITGHGYADKIKSVYKLCCTDMCSDDEIFLFGFSRGAFVVRAVAGLLHHMRMLDVTAADFDARFDNAISLYRAAQEKDRLREHSVYQHLSSTKPSPCIRFIGLIDTVKALDDDNLNDIGAVRSIHHIRHALALFEKRTLMSLERFNTTCDMPAGHSIQEAWFVGTHGNLGGSCDQDGLSLWPLQWLISESERFNLVLGFQRIDSSNVTDPAAFISHRKGENQRRYVCKNGVEVLVADISKILTRDGYYPTIKHGKGKFPSPKEFRPLFKGDKLIGQTETGPNAAFIHQSVFFLDDTDPEIIYAMMNHPDCDRIRAQRLWSMASGDKAFWAGSEELQLNRQSTCSRILLTGQLNAGKSSLVNKMVGYNATLVSHGADPGEHDINVAFSDRNKTIVLHDSQGFEAAKSSNYRDVADFVEQRRREPVFENQIHCIWYCVSTDLQRVQKVDQKFANIDFGGVPVVLVFTKTDKLRRSFEEKALSEYNKDNGSRFTIFELATMPPEEQENIFSKAHTLFEAEKDRRKMVWTQKFPNLFSDTVFIANPDYDVEDPDTIAQLTSVSKSSMTGDRMARIHSEAQNNFVEERWDEIIDTVIEVCDEKGDLISCLKKHDTNKVRLEITQLMTEKVARIFELENFNRVVAFPTITNILYPIDLGHNSSIKKSLASVAATTVAGLGSGLLGPIGWLATAGTLASLLTVREDLSSSNKIVISCLEIAFVLERIFWFGTSDIDEKMVTAATLYYLKRREKVFLTAKKELSIFDSIKKMKPTLSKIVAQFRYQRQSS